jgi:hypothetical protein
MAGLWTAERGSESEKGDDANRDTKWDVSEIPHRKSLKDLATLT